jgi:hypothetical protein
MSKEASRMLLLARELVHKQREVESLQYANRRLKAALKDMCELWESMGTQIPPLLNEQKYLNAKAIVGKDTDVPANAPDTNVGKMEK